jgi:hypothetical protein
MISVPLKLNGLYFFYMEQPDSRSETNLFIYNQKMNSPKKALFIEQRTVDIV